MADPSPPPRPAIQAVRPPRHKPPPTKTAPAPLKPPHTLARPAMQGLNRV
jgi:hypothetical protein